MIELKNVTKIYKLGKTKVVALKNINLIIDKKEFIYLDRLIRLEYNKKL